MSESLISSLIVLIPTKWRYPFIGFCKINTIYEYVLCNNSFVQAYHSQQVLVIVGMKSYQKLCAEHELAEIQFFLHNFLVRLECEAYSSTGQIIVM